MDYEKKYKEALERAKDYHKQLIDEDNPEWAGEIENIFPELQESEDERIRKALMWFVERFPYDRLDNNGVSVKEALAWLEKQGKKKSAWNGADDYNVQCCIAKIENDIANGRLGRNKELIEWLQSLKQRMEEQQ